MVRVGRIIEPGVLELLEEESDALVAVAAVRIAGVTSGSRRGTCSAAPAAGFRPIGGDRALGALRRDRPRAVRQQQADQQLEREEIGGSGEAEQCT